MESEVKSCADGFLRARESDGFVDVDNILKNDGKLTIKCEDTVKEVSNVEQVEDNLYLTKDGKLYELGLNSITEEINPKLIKENVKKLIDECIVLGDGSTWWAFSSYKLEFEKIADFEIKDMGVYEEEGYYYKTVVGVDNILWRLGSGGLEKIKENFEGYKYNQVAECAGDRVVISGEGDAVWESDGSVLLKNVSEVHLIRGTDQKSLLLLRTDGTIWTYNAINGLTKITASTSVDEKKEPVEFLNPTARIHTRELGTTTMISGISKNTSVEEFMNQNNFNNEYQIKVFDKNNNEITGESLLGTGSTVRLYENGKLVKEYVVVVYGDTNGDGKITAVDALAVIKHINNKVLFTKEAYIEAGRVKTTSRNTLTSVDALAIIKGVNGKFTIDQNK